ncbi:TB2/DP1/HVA22-related protein [Gracilaria domingensis]|nr:TB2/DP1/HVA22-related protein [Gracilaria domingensis]
MLGLVYPGYQSFKAVKRVNVPKQQAWLKYWLVLSVVAFLSLIVEPILYDRVPLWNLLKIAFVGFLVLPMTKGYERIYQIVLEPQLEKHEAVIDETASKLYQAGEEHARNLGPTVTKLVQQGRSVAEKRLKKAQ